MNRTETTKNCPLQRAFTLLLALMLAALALSGCKTNAAAGAQTSPTDEPAVEHTDEPTALPEFIKQISTANDNDEASGKPLPTQHIDISCFSFYANGSKIIVDAAMGDMYSLNGYPNFDSFDEENYPILNVIDYSGGYEMRSNGFDLVPVKQSKMKINGMIGEYEKRFEREDMEELEIPWLNLGTERAKMQAPSEWHHETLEIDFSDLKAGDYGEIAFFFGWRGTNETLGNIGGAFRERYLTGQRRFLYYYVGDEGIGLSIDGWNTAYWNVKRNIEPQELEFRGQGGCIAP